MSARGQNSLHLTMSCGNQGRSWFFPRAACSSDHPLMALFKRSPRARQVMSDKRFSRVATQAFSLAIYCQGCMLRKEP